VEGVFRFPAVGRRICQRTDHLEKFEDGSRPTVRENNGQRAFMLGADVNEVDAERVDLGPKLREAIEKSFGTSPVILLLPIGHERLQAIQRDTLRPIGNRLALGPARFREAAFQVV